MQTLQKAGCFLPNYLMPISLDEWLRMKINSPPSDVEHETAVVETLRKYFSKVVNYKFSDLIRAQANKKWDWVEDSDIMLTFVRSAWICGYGAPTLEDYDWKGNKVIVREERLGERYDQRILPSVCFEPTKKAKNSVVMLKSEEGGVTVVWSAKLVVLLHSRC